MPSPRRTSRFRVGPARVTSRTVGGDLVKSVRSQMELAERRLARIIKKIEGATPEALLYALEPMFDKSWMYTPVDTGALKLSGYLQAEQTRWGSTAVIGYGADGDPKYAIFVHEMVENQHAAPTRAKFLEEAMNEHIDEVPRLVHEYLKKEFDGMTPDG